MIFKRSILESLILFLDNFSQRKNITFVKKIFKNEINIFFDVGCHKAETIDIFQKYFKINKIFAFDINKHVLDEIDKSKYTNASFFNIGLAQKNYTRKIKIEDFSFTNSLQEINKKSSYNNFKKLVIKLLDFPRKKFSNDFYKLEIITIDKFCRSNSIPVIDLLKIDVEGGELNVLKGSTKFLRQTKSIIFEHHYDDSIIKQYKFSDINNFLIKHGFIKVSKNKLLFRKIFDYIYVNKAFFDEKALRY
tara:strand:- start:542 stop:1285 length:744 start_codon:yes stop_codon:yes gene_type:complete